MKIYYMIAPIVDDDILFRGMFYKDSKWAMSDQGIQSKKDGNPIEATWGEYSLSKPLGDSIMFPGSCVLSKKQTIESIKKFAPTNVVNAIEIDGRSDVFALLQPKNYDLDATGLEHIFMMFSKYKKLLVTEVFKDEWEIRGLTGAEFTFVTEMDDSRFIPVATATNQATN